MSQLSDTQTWETASTKLQRTRDLLRRQRGRFHHLHMAGTVFCWLLVRRQLCPFPCRPWTALTLASRTLPASLRRLQLYYAHTFAASRWPALSSDCAVWPFRRCMIWYKHNLKTADHFAFHQRILLDPLLETCAF